MLVTLQKMRSLGPIVVIGGILRDLILANNKEFRSDLDLVINPQNPDVFREYVMSLGAERNRFGGFVLPRHKWSIDVWLLQDTWAHQAGHVKVENFLDLLDTTFFNCDAIIYDLSCGKVATKSEYFNELSRGLLEINLLPNPNPIGNAVRAFRYAVEKDFTWGPKLTKFMEEILDNTDWQLLVNYEQNSYHTRTIDSLPKDKIRRNLKRYIADDRNDVFVPFENSKWEQLPLPL